MKNMHKKRKQIRMQIQQDKWNFPTKVWGNGDEKVLVSSVKYANMRRQKNIKIKTKENMQIGEDKKYIIHNKRKYGNR